MRALSISIASMVALAAAFVVLLASPALAGPSCSFSGSTLTIDLSAFPSAVVRTDGNAIIVADNDFVPVNCGGSPT
jgi:hypothetical protein